VKVLGYTESYASETVTFITNELNEVDKRHTLKLLCSKRINEDRFDLKDILIVEYKFNRIFNKIRWWLEQFKIYFWLSNKSFKKEVNSIIDEFMPDVIHCHFGTSFLVLAANLSKKNLEIPIVISFYGFDASERIKNKAVVKAYKKYLKNKNVRSFAVSQNLVDNINSILSPAADAEVLYSGVDTNFFSRIDLPKTEDFVFLQIASFREKKGHVYALEAFKKLIESEKDKSLKFIIAGFGPLEKRIKEKILELNLGNFVEVLGTQTPSELRSLASRSNCFVHHSITSENGDVEGLPNVLLEMMSIELPILSTLHGGIPHIIEDEVNGYLVPEKDTEAFYKAMKKVLLWEYCPNNRQKIIDIFSFEKHMENLENIYSEKDK